MPSARSGIFFADLPLFPVVFALATLDKRNANSAPMFGPGEAIAMHLEYQNISNCCAETGATSLRFPLVAAPRRTSALPLHNLKFERARRGVRSEPSISPNRRGAWCGWFRGRRAQAPPLTARTACIALDERVRRLPAL